MILELFGTAGQLLGMIPLQIPDPAPAQPPNTGGVSTIIGWLKWVGLVISGGAIIAGGALIAVAALRRGEGQEALTKIIWPCAGAIVVGGGISMIGLLAGG